MWKRILTVLVLGIVILYFFDFGFLRGEITEYPLFCEKKNYINYLCNGGWLPLNPTTYKPNADKQQVIYWSWAVPQIETLTKCTVIDRKNWTCKFDDGSAEFGFKNGHYWHIPLDETLLQYSIGEYQYVPKYIYKLEELGVR